MRLRGTVSLGSWSPHLLLLRSLVLWKARVENLAFLGRRYRQRGQNIMKALLHSDSSESPPYTKASLRSGGVFKMETNLYSGRSRVFLHKKKIQIL